MKNVSTSLLSLVAGLSLSWVVGCGDSGSSGGSGGNAGKGGSGIAGQSGRGGATGTGGGVPASGGTSGCTRCDASPDVATGGAGGQGGAGGATSGQPDVAVDVAWPDVPGTGGVLGTGGRGTGGAGGIDSGAGGAGGSLDGARDSTDGPIDRSLDNQACINLGDIPSAWVQTADPATRISTMVVVDGPCNASSSMMTVEFHYWEKGYSCPRLSDRVTCTVEATWSTGATTIFSVDFVAVPLGAAMLHWQAEPSQITLTFPTLDGGADGGGAGG